MPFDRSGRTSSLLPTFSLLSLSYLQTAHCHIAAHCQLSIVFSFLWYQWYLNTRAFGIWSIFGPCLWCFLMPSHPSCDLPIRSPGKSWQACVVSICFDHSHCTCHMSKHIHGVMPPWIFLFPWVQLSLLKSQQGAPESVEAPEDQFEWGRGYRIRMILALYTFYTVHESWQFCMEYGV